MSQHTPGPWSTKETMDEDMADAGLELVIYDADGCSVAYARSSVDARLIAAAPEMFTLLMHLADPFSHPLAGAENTLAAFRNEARALLAKIEGRDAQ